MDHRYLEEERPERDLGQLHHHGEQAVDHAALHCRRLVQVALCTQKHLEPPTKHQEHRNDVATLENLGGGTDLTVLGPEVQGGQEEGGEHGLLIVQLFVFHVGNVLPQDDHQRPQLCLREAVVHVENVKVRVVSHQTGPRHYQDQSIKMEATYQSTIHK